ncbi:MAG: CRISPR-associated endonuclease Cas3'' [Ruthenibacterium lactatiformans]
MFCSPIPAAHRKASCRAAKKGAAMENKFLAHIAEDGREQTVFEHLAGAASLSAEFSRPFGGEAQGLLAGTAHDIGKYSAAFQRRLTGDSRRVDHATAGAFECMGRGQPFAAFAVAGHHGGLPMAAGAETARKPPPLGTDQTGGPRRAGALRRLGQEVSCPADNLPLRKAEPGSGHVLYPHALFLPGGRGFSGYRGLHVREAGGSCSGCWKKKAPSIRPL